jgi:putative transposase
MATKTAKQKLRNYTRYLSFTLDIYRNALSFVNKIVYAEWPAIETLPHPKSRINYVENLIHATSTNICPKHAEFDRDFYKFPSYLRRAVISKAIGHVSSHISSLRNWEAESTGDKPALQQECDSFPVFYKDNMSKWIENGKVKLKCSPVRTGYGSSCPSSRLN